ncbi:MAG: AraC family transcriptional regulator [Aerococcus sp.]|nr:AraC family transcriptional regulator [Aerococcus sp.]
MASEAPYRIKVIPIGIEQMGQYNHSYFHRKELMFIQQPITLQFMGKETVIAPRQVLVIPEQSEVVFNVEKTMADNEGKSTNTYGYLLSIGDTYLETIAKDFIDTPQMLELFQSLHIITFSDDIWQWLIQITLQLKRQQQSTLTDLKRKLCYGIVIQLLGEVCYRLSEELNHIQIDEREIMARHIATYLEQHFQQALTLHHLEDYFKASASTLNRNFQMYYHSTIHQRLIFLRVQFAYRLIEQGQRVNAAWKAAGFNDYSTFYRAFSKFYHFPPHDIERKSDS